MFHHFAHDAFHCRHLLLRRLEDDLVVHLQEHARGKLSAASPLYSRTIASLTMSAAVPWMGELTATLCAAVFSVRLLLVMAATRQPAAHEGMDEPGVLGGPDCFLQEPVHALEPLEIGLDEPVRIGARDSKLCASPKEDIP